MTSTDCTSPFCRVDPEVSRLSTYWSPFGAVPGGGGQLERGAAGVGERDDEDGRPGACARRHRGADPVVDDLRLDARVGSMIASGVGHLGRRARPARQPGRGGRWGVLGRGVVA